MANWITLEDLRAKFSELQADPFQRDADHTLLLGFHCLMLPLRGGDLGTVRVKCGTAEDKIVRDDAGEAVNCIVLHCATMDDDATSAHLSMSQFKVARSHGSVVVDVPEPLVKLLQSSLRRKPRDHVFVDRSGKPRTRIAHSNWAVGAMSRLLGARVTTTLLRHAAATEVDYNTVEAAELEKRASAMMTSSRMLFNTYRIAGAHKQLRSPARKSPIRRGAASAVSPAMSPAASQQHVGETVTGSAEASERTADTIADPTDVAAAPLE